MMTYEGHLTTGASDAKDRDIGRFHCTTDFFAEVEYWIRESRLIALICEYLRYFALQPHQAFKHWYKTLI